MLEGFDRTWLTNGFQPGTWPPAFIFTWRFDSVFGIKCSGDKKHAADGICRQTSTITVTFLSSFGGETYQTLMLFFFLQAASSVEWVGDILSVSDQPAGACGCIFFPLSAHYRLQDMLSGPRHAPNQYTRMYNPSRQVTFILYRALNTKHFTQLMRKRA